MPLSIGLDTAVSAVRAMQLAIDTAAHNVANADTDGYSRQEVVLRAVPPVRSKWVSPGVPLQQLGLGVESSRIRRIRDVLLDTQYRDVRGPGEEYQARAAALQQTETILNEPSDNGLQAQMTKLFGSFQDLASQPESVAARAATVEQGVTFAATFNRASVLLTNQRADLNASVDLKVAEVNVQAREVATLNGEIRKLTIAGGTANDLYDRRDLVLDQLAGVAGATFETAADGSVNVLIGTRKLVDNVTVDALTTQPDPLNGNMKKVVFSTDSGAATLRTGALKAIIDTRDGAVAGVLSSLNTLAGAVITAVNAVHQTGYGLNNATGLTFFTGTTAGDIGVNATLRASPQSLATSDASNEPGNPNVARAIAGVANALLMNGGTTTAGDSYRAVVASLGVNTQQAVALSENQDVLVRQIDAARQSVAGVSIDEEMTNVMKGQRAYQAAARVITAVDEMLDTLINRTG